MSKKRPGNKIRTAMPRKPTCLSDVLDLDMAVWNDYVNGDLTFKEANNVIGLYQRSILHTLCLELEQRVENGQSLFPTIEGEQTYKTGFDLFEAACKVTGTLPEQKQKLALLTKAMGLLESSVGLSLTGGMPPDAVLPLAGKYAVEVTSAVVEAQSAEAEKGETHADQTADAT